MLAFLHAQRRRIYLTTFFVTISFITLIMQIDPSWLVDQPLSNVIFYLTALSIVTLGLGIIAAVVGLAVAMIFPTLRHLCDAIVFLLFFYAVVFSFWPAIADNELLDAALSLLAVVTYSSIVFGYALDRLPLRYRHVAKARLRIPQNKEELWATLRPGRGPIKDYFDPRLASADPDEDDPDSFEIEYHQGAGSFDRKTITYLEEVPNERFSYFVQGEVMGKRRDLLQSTYEVTLSDHPKGGTLVTTVEKKDELLFRWAIADWIDDNAQDALIALRARLTGKRDWSLTGHYIRKVLEFS